jgi:hypothetical protein
MLVVGMVIWLASMGIFKDPLVVAASLGIGTLLLLASGWWVIRRTQFHMAGQAVTLLACLVMPLNLWFYHAHQLLTLDGHLWVAAVVCCALYAASALALRDPLFVYVLMAGVAGTGLLILADMHKFAEIASPALMLVVMGLIGIHAEQSFPTTESPFSRKRFGMAFFFSGHALLAGGLILLLGAQLTGWVIRPILAAATWSVAQPEVTTIPSLRMLAIVLVLAGTYAYVYSDLVVRHIGAYVYPAAFTLLWAELLGLQMLNFEHRPELILAVVSFTALALNLVHALFTQQPRFTRPIGPLALLLSFVPVAYGLLLHVRATHSAVYSIWPYQISWGYVGAMVVAAVACRIGAFLHRKTSAILSDTYFFLTAGASIVGAAGLLAVLGISAWSSQAPMLMLIPLAYLAASRAYPNQIERNSLVLTAKVATVVMLISVLASATRLDRRVFEPVEGQPLNVMLAIFFAEGAIFFAILATIQKDAFHIFLSTAMAGGALWQLLTYFHTPAEAYMINFAVFGLVMLIGSRFMPGLPGRSALGAGNALMSLSFLSSALMVFSRILISGQNWNNAGLLALMMLLTLAAAGVVGRFSPWRRAYIVMTIVNGGIAFILLSTLSHLSGWRKAEIFGEAAGVALLVLGHVGWFREQGKPDDTVSFSLALGALLAGLPVFIAAVVNRFAFEISLPDEIGLLTISALMLLSGLMLQLRSTTITGGSLLALHVTLLLAFAGWKAQLAVGVYLSIGGAVIFLLGLSLAIYRDQLLMLPGRIERREGLFRVLAWR